MESTRHENKENCVPRVANAKQNAMAVRQNISVMGNRNTNVQHEAKGKKPMAFSQISMKENIESGKNKEAIFKSKTNIPIKDTKENLKNIVNPVIPCNQFKAFKVYEEETYTDRIARIDEKLKSKAKHSTFEIYKGTEERFYTKTEVAELKKQYQESNPDLITENVKEESPIKSHFRDIVETFIEKQIEENKKDNVEKRVKDRFFEMDEYRSDIYAYLREHEQRHRAKPGYMKKQPDITSNMRTILVDWLVEVAEEYKLHTETLYLAVNYIDRFLSYMSVVRAKLQLVGTAAMFLASKYEEIYPPEITEFVYITDDTYTKRQVIRMEQLILKVLGFDLSIPTPLTFITAMCVSNKLDDKTKYLAMYLSELSLLNGEVYLEFLPSVLAASSIALARHTLNEEPWSESLTTTTGYELKQLEAGVEFLNQMFISASTMPQHAIQDKYKSKKCMHVSTIPPRKTQINFT